MKWISTIFYLLTVGFLASCSTYKLDEEDIQLNPYKGNDVLIFKNHLNEYDTVVITGVDRYINSADPLSFFGDRLETLIVSARFSDPFSNDHRYLDGSFLTISRSKDSVYIEFDLALRNSFFYGPPYKNTMAVQNTRTINLNVQDVVYQNVRQIYSLDTEYKKRDDFINSFYWSKEYGYVKAEMSRGRYWYLVQRIRK